MIDNIIFIVVALAAFGLFGWQFSQIWGSIKLGLPISRKDNPGARFSRMLLVAFGQKKMFKRPLPAILHGLVYVGFIIINIELLEILIDGVFGTHRALSFTGPFYDGLTAANEVLGFLVIFACIMLLYRRNIMKVKRLNSPEMTRWPKLDANLILYTEIVLMFFLFAFNISEYKLTAVIGGPEHGLFPISGMLAGMFPDVSGSNLGIYEVVLSIGWWGHILGIFAFMNYLPISKHFHIIMAFPNVYGSKLEPAGQIANMDSVTSEVKAMMDPSAPIEAAPEGEEMPRLGARDVTDLPWSNLMDAYTCTECGRCTDNCPANITGKKLSPRKIIMDTRDRLEELKRAKLLSPDAVKAYAEKNNKFLLGEYISPEELWACTTCNACVEACPVNIDHVSEIIDLRRYMVMEEASAPVELNSMLTNIQNNGAPWPMAASARFNWADEVEMRADKVASKA
ncbi:MAG TPA: (Fe-S)-binding protein [Bacteroidetes bacterium]|nr:(Fe-S)-binding protein [Bacteroidota bacterium]